MCLQFVQIVRNSLGLRAICLQLSCNSFAIRLQFVLIASYSKSKSCTIQRVSCVEVVYARRSCRDLWMGSTFPSNSEQLFGVVCSQTFVSKQFPAITSSHSHFRPVFPSNSKQPSVFPSKFKQPCSFIYRSDWRFQAIPSSHPCFQTIESSHLAVFIAPISVSKQFQAAYQRFQAIPSSHARFQAAI